VNVRNGHLVAGFFFGGGGGGGGPHEEPEYVGSYYIMKLNSYTQVNC
jgi:hypothetical protein